MPGTTAYKNAQRLLADYTTAATTHTTATDEERKGPPPKVRN